MSGCKRITMMEEVETAGKTSFEATQFYESI